MKLPQHTQLLIALILAVFTGFLLHPYADIVWLNSFNTHFLQPIGQIFLRMIFMVVVPLLFSALTLGVYELGEHHNLGRVASKTLFFTLLASAISVLIGITLVNLFRPGDGVPLDPSLISQQMANVQSLQKNVAEAKPFSQILVELVPKNPIDSAARALSGEIIALMVFALIFGIALAKVDGKRTTKSPIVALLEQTYAVCMKVITFAMKLAPIGVFALVFNTVFKSGTGVLNSIFLYASLVILGLLLQQFVVYSLLLKTFTRRSPWAFFKACREVYLYAFTTASSNATLPKALETAEHKLKLSPEVSRFVLTVGSTANQNGTALFEGITVLFLAQVYHVDLSIAQQIQVVLMSILAGIGTAGVPGGSLPLIMILLQSLGIPPESIGLILGVDRFLDMCRTTLNVSGDLVIATLVNPKTVEN